MIQEISNVETSLAENEIFKSLAQKLSLFLASEGVLVRTYSKDLPYFSKLSLEQKRQVNKHMGFYIELCREQIGEGYSLKDGSSFLWRALRRLNLVPRSDLFQHFNDDSVIEIYSSESVQLFRNLNFFKYCSYTLEEMHSREWWLLYYREAHLTEKLFDWASKIVTGEMKENVLQPVPVHTVRELESAELFEMEVDLSIISPLTQNKQVAAYVVAENVKIVNSVSMANN